MQTKWAASHQVKVSCDIPHRRHNNHTEKHARRIKIYSGNDLPTSSPLQQLSDVHDCYYTAILSFTSSCECELSVAMIIVGFHSFRRQSRQIERMLA